MSELNISGVAGGAFVVRGAHFGEDKGSVTVGGVAADITTWNDSRIKGVLPKTVDTKAPVVVTGKFGSLQGTFGVAARERMARLQQEQDAANKQRMIDLELIRGKQPVGK